MFLEIIHLTIVDGIDTGEYKTRYFSVQLENIMLKFPMLSKNNSKLRKK